MPKRVTFFRYVGGKHYMLNDIIPLIPKHTTYVEAFGGSAKLLLTKDRSKIEVYNDYDKDIANLFYVVAFHFNEFYDIVSKLAYSRTIYGIIKKRYKEMKIENIPDVQRAVDIYYLLNCSFAGRLGNFGYARQRNEAMVFKNKIQNLPQIFERLQGVIIECLDFENIIKKYDSEDTFFYIDPPYYKAEFYYETTFNEQDHIRLLKTLKQIKGKFLLSHYSNELYVNELKNYPSLKFEKRLWSAYTKKNKRKTLCTRNTLDEL